MARRLLAVSEVWRRDVDGGGDGAAAPETKRRANEPKAMNGGDNAETGDDAHPSATTLHQ